MQNLKTPLRILCFFCALHLCLYSFGQESKKKSSDRSKEVYMTSSVMPEFPGGEQAMISYLTKNVAYPEAAKKDKAEGKVFINFIVNEDGTISHAIVMKGVRADLDKEALRVILGMPKWKPGTQDGKEVNVYMNIPISFKLAEEKKN